MWCLNMQAPNGQSLNIRLRTGASVLSILVSCQFWIFAGVVGKRESSLLCILFSSAVPLLHCLSILGTSTWSLEYMQKVSDPTQVQEYSSALLAIILDPTVGALV